MQQGRPETVVIGVALELGNDAYRPHTEKTHPPVQEIENYRCHRYRADISGRFQVPDHCRIDHALQGNSQIGQD